VLKAVGIIEREKISKISNSSRFSGESASGNRSQGRTETNNPAEERLDHKQEGGIQHHRAVLVGQPLFLPKESQQASQPKIFICTLKLDSWQRKVLLHLYAYANDHSERD
jgi:hypothetical protein